MHHHSQLRDKVDRNPSRTHCWRSPVPDGDLVVSVART